MDRITRRGLIIVVHIAQAAILVAPHYIMVKILYSPRAKSMSETVANDGFMMNSGTISVGGGHDVFGRIVMSLMVMIV